ncbi:MAG: hypothetical protein OXJ52_00220 [Oligoflexia bacterium]|nr:hypothetical protein [Oligoflexia bacterium]
MEKYNYQLPIQKLDSKQNGLFLKSVLLSAIIVCSACKEKTTQAEHTGKMLKKEWQMGKGKLLEQNRKLGKRKIVGTEPQTRQKEIQTAESKEERLQTVINQMKAFEADPDKRKGVKPKPGTIARYINFTSDKDEASYRRYPDKYMNKVSMQEALFLMTSYCSILFIYPKEAEYIKSSSVICEEYSHWLGLRRGGLQCFCRFTHTQVNTIFYKKPFLGEYQGSTNSNWQEDYKRLTQQK